MRSRRLAALLMLVAVGLAGALEAHAATPVPTATPVLVSVAVSPRAATRQVGEFQNFSVVGTLSDGSTKNYTQKVTYFSSDLSVVYPPNLDGNAGRVEAVGVGTATVSVVDPATGIGSEASGESAVMQVVEAPTPTPTNTGVTPTRTKTPTPTATATPMLVSLAISPLEAKRNVGQTQNFVVQGTYSDGSTKNLTQSATYGSSNTSVVQCPNDTTANKGTTLAVGPGLATISAAFAGVTTTATGGDAEFTVVVAPTPTATHTGATPTKTVSPTPTATATPVLVSLAVAPQTVKRQVGQFQNFSATGTLSDGSTKNYTQLVTYFSSNLAVAFPPNIDGNAGRVEAVGVGSATISVVDPATGIGSDASGGNATFDVVEAPTPTPTNTGVTPTRTKTPTPTATATPKLVALAATPLEAKRNVGQTQNFVVQGTYSDGSTKNLTQSATYSSSNTAVVQCPNDTTANKGTTLAVGPGVATISAAFAGVTTTTTGGDAEFTVVVAPTPTATHTGATPTKTVSPTPTATATPVLVSLALDPQSTEKKVGEFKSFTATGTFSDGSTKNLTQRATYASSNPNVASAPNDTTLGKSRVIAVGVGTAIISAVDDDTGIGTAASGGNATFVVVLAPTPTPTNTGVTPTRTKTPTPTPTATPALVSLAISPLSVKKPAGQFQNFIVNGTFSNGDVRNVTQKVDYISSKPTVAQALNDPNVGKSRVTAVAPGVAIISAKDPATGIRTALDESATFTVIEGPTPTPTHTGPTSTGPTRTPTPKPSPTATATPILTKIEIKPATAQKPVGTSQNFVATGTFSDGSSKNVTGKLHYTSSDPTIASAPNDPTNPSKIVPLKVGTVTISASDPTTGVSSSDSGGDAILTVVAASGSPRPPHATPTPSLPDQTGGNSTTACQRDVRRAARTYVGKKLKTLEKCAGAASTCVQRKPDDPKCLPGVRNRCAAVLGKLANDETRLTAAVIKKCAGLSSTDVLGDDGLAYGDIANSCAIRFGRALSDLTSVAQCLAAQHSCRAETLFALERPRAGELLHLADAAPDAEACRQDFGGTGVGVGDPKGAGKALERCVQALVNGGEGLVQTRLGSIGQCVDAVFVCVEAAKSDPTCLAKATQKCERQFGRVQREVAKLALAAGKRCNGVDFGVLGAATGGNLDAVTPTCPSYGIPTVTALPDYVACLVRQHECDVAELVRFESPRAESLLEQVGRTLVDGTCPAP